MDPQSVEARVSVSSAGDSLADLAFKSASGSIALFPVPGLKSNLPPPVDGYQLAQDLPSSQQIIFEQEAPKHRVAAQFLQQAFSNPELVEFLKVRIPCYFEKVRVSFRQVDTDEIFSKRSVLLLSFPAGFSAVRKFVRSYHEHVKLGRHRPVQSEKLQRIVELGCTIRRKRLEIWPERSADFTDVKELLSALLELHSGSQEERAVFELSGRFLKDWADRRLKEQQDLSEPKSDRVVVAVAELIKSGWVEAVEVILDRVDQVVNRHELALLEYVQISCSSAIAEGELAHRARQSYQQLISCLEQAKERTLEMAVGVLSDAWHAIYDLAAMADQMEEDAWYVLVQQAVDDYQKTINQLTFKEFCAALSTEQLERVDQLLCSMREQQTRLMQHFHLVQLIEELSSISSDLIEAVRFGQAPVPTELEGQLRLLALRGVREARLQLKVFSALQSAEVSFRDGRVVAAFTQLSRLLESLEQQPDQEIEVTVAALKGLVASRQQQLTAVFNDYFQLSLAEQFDKVIAGDYSLADLAALQAAVLDFEQHLEYQGQEQTQPQVLSVGQQIIEFKNRTWISLYRRSRRLRRLLGDQLKEIETALRGPAEGLVKEGQAEQRQQLLTSISTIKSVYQLVEMLSSSTFFKSDDEAFRLAERIKALPD